MADAAVQTRTTKRAVEEFDRDAKSFAKRATKSRRAARKVLVGMGIYRKDGRLAAKYR